MPRIILLAALATGLVACDSQEAAVGLEDPPAPTASGAVATVRMSADPVESLVGTIQRLVIEAYDSSGTRVSTDRAVVSSSNASVVIVSEIGVNTVHDARTGLTRRELSPSIRLLAPGVALLRVTLDGASDSLLVSVRLPPPDDAALVVESFSVIEYRAACAWACPYLIYAPLLKLHEPTGKRTVEVVGVEITLGGMTRACRGGRVVYGPGLSAYLFGFYEYLWSNDLIFASIDGQPLPGDEATARVVLRNAQGNLSQFETTGPVQRMVANPQLPAAGDDAGWVCT